MTAQLIDVASGFHLYSQSYDREMQDIFDIQNEIARQIVHALMPKLGLQKDAIFVEHGTTNLEAYNLWLKAHWWSRIRSSTPLRRHRGSCSRRSASIAITRTRGSNWPITARPPTCTGPGGSETTSVVAGARPVKNS